MFHYFLISAFCGFGFIAGISSAIWFIPSKEMQNATQRNLDIQERNMQALQERNAQWRPSQLDYFAAAAMQGDWAAQDETNGQFYPDADDKIRAVVAANYYKAARAMIDESAKHKGYLPPVPPDISDLLPSKGRQV